MSIFSYCRSSRYVSCVCHRMSKIHPHTYTHLWLSVCTYKYILPHTHTYTHRYHIISSKFVNFVPAIQPCPLRFRNLPHEAGEERSLARYLGVIASIRQPLQCCPKTNKNCTILSINISVYEYYELAAPTYTHILSTIYACCMDTRADIAQEVLLSAAIS